MVERVGSKKELARRTGLPASTISRMCAGENEPSIFDVVTLAEQLGCSLEWLAGLEEGEEIAPKTAAPTIDIQKLDVRAAAGGGAVNVGKVEEILPFPLWMARKLSKNVSKLRLLRATGESMEPTIHHRALLLVDEDDRNLPKTPLKPKKAWDQHDIYVFTQGDEVRVKRLRQDPKGPILALSDNPAYGPEILRKQDFKIEGRVVWWDNRL